MKGKDYLVKFFQDTSNEEIVRFMNCLNICANEFFPHTHANMCRYSDIHDIHECERCWQYSLTVDQGEYK